MNKTKPHRPHLYIYVRTSNGDENSYTQQVKKGKKLSKYLGVDYSVINDEIDTDDDTMYYDLRDFIVNNPRTCIFVVGLDRISRNSEILDKTLDLMMDYHITLMTENEGNYFNSKTYIMNEIQKRMTKDGNYKIDERV